MINLTVGPVESPTEVLAVSKESAPYFRTPEFSRMTLESERMLLGLLNAPEGSRCCFLTASGTGAMEAVVMGALRPGERVLVVNGGSFGARFAQLASLHGRDVTEIAVPFGRALTREALWSRAESGATAVLVNMHETSSGTLYDMPMIAEFCRETGAALIVDAISSFVADELDMDAVGACAVIVGSQKALALHPGLSAVALSPEGVSRALAGEDECLYLSLREALINGERGQTPWTPAVTTMLELSARLRAIGAAGGLGAERARIRSLAEGFRAGIGGLPLSPASESPSWAVTAVRPARRNAQEVVSALRERFGIWVCPNGGALADEVFRVGHLGAISEEDVGALLSALRDLSAEGTL